MIWRRRRKKIELHNNLWIHFCIIEFPCYSLMHVCDGVEQQQQQQYWEEKIEAKTKKKTWFMLNNILLILKRKHRMAEHNAVIYVYCDFNLKLPHRLEVALFALEPFDRSDVRNAMCAMACAVRDFHSRIDESISLSRGKLTTPQPGAFAISRARLY